MSSPENNKEIAIKFLKLVVAGETDKAYNEFVDLKGKHHNTYFPAGFSVLKEGMKENHVQFPNKKLHIINILSDGDLVAAHSHLAFKEGEPGMIVVHLFRFKNGKIVEFWDCGQPIQEDSPNKDGAF
jgi:predicted SnoaL-like aldol condensation-catalyzing enzyme